MKPRKLTKRQREREQQEREKWAERLARIERHEKLLADGYTLIRGHDREHPAHSAEFVVRIDALARYIGCGNYEPNSSHGGRRKRASRLWHKAFGNYWMMLHDPDWWQANTGQYAIVFPADVPPPPTTVPAPVYVKDGSILSHEPFDGVQLYGVDI